MKELNTWIYCPTCRAMRTFRPVVQHEDGAHTFVCPKCLDFVEIPRPLTEVEQRRGYLRGVRRDR